MIALRNPAQPVVGVLGAGQLGRMIGLAAIPLGVRCVFLDPAPDPPAAAVGEVITAGYEPEALGDLAQRSDVITWEFENVPHEAAAWLAERTVVAPEAVALASTQDRAVEKAWVRSLGIPTADFAVVDDRADLDRVLDDPLDGVGARTRPTIIKTRRLGYDGHGQARIGAASTVAQRDAAWEAIGCHPAIVERTIAFDDEWSILVVRDRSGSIATWTPVRNVHHDGILHESIVDPGSVPDAVARRAGEIGRAVVEALDYVGVLAVECFAVGDDLLVNEIAPRVHNSGHSTIEGAHTSQFENHVRAVLDLPLGSTAPRCPSIMVNLVGTRADPAAVLAIPGAHLHVYDKAPRPGRKLGHVTLTAADTTELHARRERLRTAIGV